MRGIKPIPPTDNNIIKSIENNCNIIDRNCSTAKVNGIYLRIFISI